MSPNQTTTGSGREPEKPSVTAYVLALTAVAVAVVVRILLDPLLSERLPFITLFVAVFFAAWHGGRGPALMALLVGAFATAYFIIRPRFSFAIDEFEYQVGLVLYVIVGLTSIALFDSLRKAKRRAEYGEQLLRATFASIGDGVITTEADGKVTLLNPVAQELTGWTQAAASGKPLHVVFNIVNEQTRRQVDNPVETALREGRIVGLANHTLLISKDGTERAIDDSAAPIFTEGRSISGAVLVFRDVTERRNLERQLEDREQQFRTLAESIPQMAWMANPDGHVFWYNRRWFEYTGKTLEETKGWGWQSVHDPQTLPEVMERWRFSIAHGEPFEMVFPLKGAGGHFRHFLTRIVPVKDDEGRVTRWFGTNTDVTRVREVEEKLRASEGRLRGVLDTLAAFVGVMTPDGILIEANRAALTAVRLTPDAVLGKPFEETYPWSYSSEVQARLRSAIAQAREGKPSRYDVRVRVAEAQFIDVDFMLHPMFNEQGVVTHLIPSAIDITDRKLAEKSLRDDEQRMRLATEATGVGIWEWNIVTGQIKWDAQMFRIYGIAQTRDGFVQYETWREAVLPEDLAEQEVALQDTVRRLGNGSRGFRIRRGDNGECRCIHAVEMVRTNAGGHAEWVVGTNLDITERKLAEDKLRLLASELSEADRRKNEFLAILAHELRNPLAPIRNGLQLLQMTVNDPNAVEQARIVMERQLTQLVRLVDDLLDVSRISRGKIELRKERVELSAVVNNAIETSRLLVEQMGHELSVTLPKQPITVDADLVRLSQVFMNLLNNAAKYTERGGHVWLTVEPQGSDVLVSVRDTGIGISGEHLAHVFEMFSQVQHSLDKAQGGLGIGLTVVKRLVEMHGGAIEAKSEGAGKGSEFVVRLPVVLESSKTPAPAAPANPAVIKSSLRILVVDDNRDAADTLSMMLKMMGNETCTAYDGEEAVAVTAAFHPNVILLDIGLPNLNGYEACRRIREQPGGKEIIIIAQTGWGQDDDRRRSHEAGFDHHMVKPVNPHALATLLAGLHVLQPIPPA